jgi:hypothetical protein
LRGSALIKKNLLVMNSFPLSEILLSPSRQPANNISDKTTLWRTYSIILWLNM